METFLVIIKSTTSFFESVNFSLHDISDYNFAIINSAPIPLRFHNIDKFESLLDISNTSDSFYSVIAACNQRQGDWDDFKFFLTYNVPDSAEYTGLDNLFTDSVKTEEQESFLGLGKNTQDPRKRSFSFRRYWDNIDIYGPIFVVLILLAGYGVLAVKIATPASNLFNSKYANSAETRHWSQKLFVKSSQTDSYWVRFKKYLKSLFKLK